MATKSELLTDWNIYSRLEQQTISAINNGNFSEAIQFALASWLHVDGMLKYSRKYIGQDIDQISTIPLALRSAVTLLSHKCLIALGTFASENKRLTKRLAVDPISQLATASVELGIACSAWKYLADKSPCQWKELENAFSNDHTLILDLVANWERLGFIRRFATFDKQLVAAIYSPSEKVKAVCPNCGERANDQRSLFWEHYFCPHCRNNALFVVVDDLSTKDPERA